MYGSLFLILSTLGFVNSAGTDKSVFGKDILDVVIALKHRNIEQLEFHVLRNSDPLDVNYGKFMSTSEIAEIIGYSDLELTPIKKDILSIFPNASIRVPHTQDFLYFSATAIDIELNLGCDLTTTHDTLGNKKSPSALAIFCEGAAFPESVQKYIEVLIFSLPITDPKINVFTSKNPRLDKIAANMNDKRSHSTSNEDGLSGPGSIEASGSLLSLSEEDEETMVQDSDVPEYAGKEFMWSNEPDQGDIDSDNDDSPFSSSRRLHAKVTAESEIDIQLKSEFDLLRLNQEEEEDSNSIRRRLRKYPSTSCPPVYKPSEPLVILSRALTRSGTNGIRIGAAVACPSSSTLFSGKDFKNLCGSTDEFEIRAFARDVENDLIVGSVVIPLTEATAVTCSDFYSGQEALEFIFWLPTPPMSVLDVTVTLVSNGKTVYKTNNPSKMYVQPIATPDFLLESLGMGKGGVELAKREGELGIIEFLEEYLQPSDLQSFSALYGASAIAQSPREAQDVKTSFTVFGPNSPAIGSSDRISMGESALDVQIVNGLVANSTFTFWSTAGRQEYSLQEPFLRWMLQLSNEKETGSAAVPWVMSISYGDDELDMPVHYITRLNSEFLKLAARGVTVLVSSGDDGSAGYHMRKDPEACGAHRPHLPAGSAWVLSVGGTQMSRRPRRGCGADDFDAFFGLKSSVPLVKDNRENLDGCPTSGPIVASARTGAIITSGGGFSQRIPMPIYQKNAVETYIAMCSPPDNQWGCSLPSKEGNYFNHNGRAYPDVTAHAANFPVVLDGIMSFQSGTSASTPLLAVFFAALNARRVASGRPRIGFVTPALYRAANHPAPGHGKPFIDVTIGDTKCGIMGKSCCELGFEAAPGWDAASGLGVPQMEELEASLKWMDTLRTNKRKAVKTLAESSHVATEVNNVDDREFSGHSLEPDTSTDQIDDTNSRPFGIFMLLIGICFVAAGMTYVLSNTELGQRLIDSINGFKDENFSSFSLDGLTTPLHLHNDASTSHFIRSERRNTPDEFDEDQQYNQATEMTSISANVRTHATRIGEEDEDDYGTLNTENHRLIAYTEASHNHNNKIKPAISTDTRLENHLGGGLGTALLFGYTGGHSGFDISARENQLNSNIDSSQVQAEDDSSMKMKSREQQVEAEDTFNSTTNVSPRDEHSSSRDSPNLKNL